jgi:hypothetical protein
MICSFNENGLVITRSVDRSTSAEAVREYREQEQRDKADTAVAQAARRRVRAELRKGK